MNPLSFLFPPKCVFCGGLLSKGGTYVCEACIDGVLLAEGGHSKRQGEFFSLAVGALEYSGMVRRALHRFKYSGRQSYAEAFVLTLDFAVRQRLGKPFDIIAAVPTTRKNLRKRGYNHAELLGRKLSSLYSVPFVDALEKSRETAPMFGLNSAQRRANVLGSVRLARGADDLAGKTVLLVDDIITTGSTFSECARILLEGGAREVFCAAVASAAPPGAKSGIKPKNE